MRGIRGLRFCPLVCLLILVVATTVVAGDGPNVPNWKLQCADGSKIEFHKELAKGPVLMAFWALWCKPCLKELPHIDKIAQEYKDQLTVLAVNIDSPKGVARVRPYISSKGYKFKVPLDTSGDLSRLLQIGSVVPFVILYDTDGSEYFRHIGYKEGDQHQLHKKVAELLQGDEATGEEAGGEKATTAETAEEEAGGEE